MRMGSDSTSKVFSVEEANRMLPLVRAIVADLVSLSQDVSERRRRLKHLLQGRELEAADVYDAELVEVERAVQRDSQRLREYTEELRQLGVVAKGHDGLVDFPTILDGRRVYLCWKLGEPEVSYWREQDKSSGGRQPLATAGAVKGRDESDAGLSP